MSPRVHMDQFEFLIKNLTPLPGLPDMMRLFEFLSPLTCDSLKPVLGSVGTALAASMQNRSCKTWQHLCLHIVTLLWQHVGNRFPPAGAARLTKPAEMFDVDPFAWVVLWNLRGWSFVCV
jgi:hypothetical protein